MKLYRGDGTEIEITSEDTDTQGGTAADELIESLGGTT